MPELDRVYIFSAWNEKQRRIKEQIDKQKGKK